MIIVAGNRHAWCWRSSRELHMLNQAAGRGVKWGRQGGRDGCTDQQMLGMVWAFET